MALAITAILSDRLHCIHFRSVQKHLLGSAVFPKRNQPPKVSVFLASVYQQTTLEGTNYKVWILPMALIFPPFFLVPANTITYFASSTAGGNKKLKWHNFTNCKQPLGLDLEADVETLAGNTLCWWAVDFSLSCSYSAPCKTMIENRLYFR